MTELDDPRLVARRRRARAGRASQRRARRRARQRRRRRRLDRWLTVNLPGSVAEATKDSYADTVRLHLVPSLGRKQLAKLTVADLDRLWETKRDSDYSSNSVRIMRTVLRRVLGQAEREGIVAQRRPAIEPAADQGQARPDAYR